MEVEEVFGQPAESHITETSVEIVHKGTPPENLGPDEGSTQNPDKSTTYEYEYYYEEEEDGTKNVDSSTSKKPEISTDSIQTTIKQEIPTTKHKILPTNNDVFHSKAF